MPRRAFHLAGYCLKVPGDASKTAENGSRFGSRSGKPVMLARGLAGIREPDDRLASPAKTAAIRRSRMALRLDQYAANTHTAPESVAQDRSHQQGCQHWRDLRAASGGECGTDGGHAFLRSCLHNAGWINPGLTRFDGHTAHDPVAWTRCASKRATPYQARPFSDRRVTSGG